MSRRNVVAEIKKYKIYEQLVLLASRYKLQDEEREYIAELVKRYDMDWAAFLGITMINRVNGVVYRNINDFKGVPKYVRYFLELAYYEQRERTSIHQREICSVSELLEKEGIRYSLLKGAVLNSVFYEPGERISNDTDIMITVDDINKVVALLKDIGYTQGEVIDGILKPATKKEILFSRLNTYETVPLNKQLDNRHMPFHEVDINFRLGNDDTLETTEEMLEDTVCLSNGSREIRTLSLEKFLLFLCVHHYREATMVMKIANGDDLTLYKFMDIHFFVTQKYHKIDWDNLLQLATRLGRVNDVYYTLYYSEMLYPGTFEIEVLEKLKPLNTDFLNQYRGKDNSDEAYAWNVEFIERVFSCQRRVEAMQNIEKENARYWDICKQLKDTDKND